MKNGVSEREFTAISTVNTIFLAVLSIIRTFSVDLYKVL